MFRYSVARDNAAAGYAIAADRFLLVIDGRIGDEHAGELWDALSRPDAVIEDILAVLARRGVDVLPDFALVELVDAPTSSVRVAARGTASVELFGPERSTVTGSDSGPWVEGSAQQVNGIGLSLREEPEGATLPIARGAVRSDRLRWGVQRAAGPAPTTTIDRTLLGDRSDEPASATAADEQTLLGGIRRRGNAEQAAARRLVLRLGDDRTFELDRPIVFGRSPQPAANPGARLAPVTSPRREVSGNHVEVRLDGRRLVVHDLDSTNGTVVRHADGSALLLRGGATILVEEGASLDIGDGNIAVLEGQV